MRKLFTLPRWENFPNEMMFNRDMVDFVNEALSDILDEENLVTNTKIQNYVKWDMLPKPIGRKYDKTHLAMLVVITVLKEVLSIPEVKKGIDLSLDLMPPQQAYDNFVYIYEAAFRNIQNTIYEGEGRFQVRGFSSTGKTLAIDSAVYSLALKFFAKEVLKADGLENLLKERKE